MNDRFGLLYDDSFKHDLDGGHDGVDLLEIIPDRFYDVDHGGRLPVFPADLPTVFHSLNLSLGSDEPLDDAYLKGISDLAGHFRPMWASDHLAVTHVDGVQLGHLSPVCWTHSAVERIAAKVARVQEKLQMPFLVENIAYYFRIPGADFTECELLAKLVQATGCGLLLDVNNVAVNAANHGFDPYVYLREFPLHAVREIHVAGHRKVGDVYIDSHGEPIDEPVWDLLRFVATELKPVNVILERDQDIPPFGELLSELATARQCVGDGRRDPVGVAR